MENYIFAAQQDETKPLILWIHGFAGRPDNDTVVEMRKRYPQYAVYSIEVDHHAHQSMAKINEYIATHDVALVAGTSLGGYYAMCSHFSGPKLLVNPVTDPVRDLRQFLGANTYKPGRPDGQTIFDFTEEMLMEFGELKTEYLPGVVCHYTAHDQLLGEDIKKDYQRMFAVSEMMGEKILPGHAVTFRYVQKVLGRTLERLLTTNT